jgi:hypothetical protein
VVWIVRTENTPVFSIRGAFLNQLYKTIKSIKDENVQGTKHSRL